MRILVLVLAVLLAASPAAAQFAGRLGGPPAGTAEEQLDYWFARLADATDEAEGEAIGDQIQQLWLSAGGPTASLLIQRAIAAAQAEELIAALDVLDGLIALQPDLPEAWHQRAIVHFQMADFEATIADVRQVLTLEPRHFAALAGLGQTFYRIGDSRRALDAVNASLAINPFQPSTRDFAEELERTLNREI